MDCILRPLNSFLENGKIGKLIKTCSIFPFFTNVIGLTFGHQRTEDEVDSIYHIIVLGYINQEKEARNRKNQ